MRGADIAAAKILGHLEKQVDAGERGPLVGVGLGATWKLVTNPAL